MKTKFNIIDVVIAIVLVIVIAVCGVIGYKFINKDSVAVSNTTKIRFTVEVNNLTADAGESFVNTVGNSVTFGPTASGMGTVTNVEVVPYRRWLRDTEKGEVVISEVPDKFTANVTIESDVVKSDISYTSGSETVAVGKSMPFNAKGAASENGYIVDLYEVK